MKNLTKDWSSFFSEKDQIMAWTSLKEGGVSTGGYSSLNLSFDVGDDPQHVLENRKRVRELYLSPSPVATAWIEAKQVHGTRCVWIEDLQSCERLQHPLDPQTYLVDGADCLITRCPHLTLVAKHADCQGALLFDPITETIATIHAGWRGLISGVYEACFEALLQRGSQLKDLKMIVSPSLQSCCAEFIHWETELGPEALNFEAKSLHFSLTRLLRAKLLKLGLIETNIFIDNGCTCCDLENFYSFRRCKNIPTGRHMSGICLKKE